MATTQQDWVHLRTTRYGWKIQPGHSTGAFNLNLREVGVSTRGMRKLSSGDALTCRLDRQALDAALAHAMRRA